MSSCGMRARRPISPASLVRVLVVALAAAHVPPARAEFGGNVSMVARAFDKLETLDGLQRCVSYRPVDMYTRLSWDDLGKRHAWAIDTSVRYRLDWGTGKVQDDHDLDVLIARATWRSPSRLLGLQLGRIQSVTGLGWKSFDGARLDFPKLPHLRVFVVAGLPVELAESGAPDTGSFTWGTGVVGMFPHHGSIGVDYELRRFGDLTTEETAGFDAAAQFGNTHVAVNADFDMVMDEFGETALVLGQDIARKHHVEARVVRVQPVTPIDSVFAVFDVNGYDEARLAYEFNADSGLSIGGAISREDYVDTELTGDQDIDRVSATARWNGHHEARHRSELSWLDGWTGSRLALRHDSDWGLTPRLRIGLGASFQEFENFARLTASDQIYAVRTRLVHDHDGRWSVGAEIEQYFGRERDTLRGMLTVGARFGSARHERPWWGGRLRGGWAPPMTPGGAASEPSKEIPQ